MTLEFYKTKTTNQFASDYLDKKESATSHFEYDWSSDEAVIERSDYLESCEYAREEISNYIENYMIKFGISEAVKRNIDLLRSDALVVVGGQQAGLLTGPMYAINKVISIIKLAEKQSEIIEKPVVPIFWIAGEDHDYQEVNHVFIKNDSQVSKSVYPYKPKTKEMVSDMVLDKEIAVTWVNELFAALQETQYTGAILEKLHVFIEKSNTISDVFANIINYLFKDSGLLLVDSGDIKFRNLAAQTYKEIIEKNVDIANALSKQQKEITALGYNNALEPNEKSANIFYYSQEHKNRMMLERDGDDFINNIYNLRLTKQEVLDATDSLSTNVVTRTIVQERAFPVLSFIAGPGEIAYWAEISPIFSYFNEKMPIVVPRTSFTLLEAKVENLIEVLGLSLDEVLETGCKREKEAYLESIKHLEAEEKYHELINTFMGMHSELEVTVGVSTPDLKNLFEKNRSNILGQLAFIKARFEQHNQNKYDNVIRKYDEIESSLRPLGGLQERRLNPIYFMNKYGKGWIGEILNADINIKENHYVLKV